MNSKWCFILLFTLSSMVMSAQNSSLKKMLKSADADYDDENYNTALASYLNYDSIHPNNPKVNFRIGQCYLHSLHQENALKYFKKAKIEDYNTGELRLSMNYHGKWYSNNIDFNLGLCYHLNHDFEKAISSYVRYKEAAQERTEDLQKSLEIVDRQIKACQYGMKIKGTEKKNIKIENVGPTINSEYPDYTPLISTDEQTLIFTSRRPNTTAHLSDPNDDNKYMEDIYISTKVNGTWSEPKNMGKNINTKTHDAALGLSPDGHELFIFRSFHHSEDIYLSTLEGNTWSEAIKLSPPINTKYFEASASLSPDGKFLYFTSNRPGGHGEKDIYVAERFDQNSWGAPKNLGATVNSAYDEDAAYMHHDGKTLYFSSTGHQGIGGYDIFKTVYDQETNSWSEPENLGFPVNSADDDLFYNFSPDGKRAYFSTHRKDSYGDQDLYVMHQEETKVSLILIKGKLLEATSNQPTGGKIKVTNLKDGSVTGPFNVNSINGQYQLVLNTGIPYAVHISSPGHIAHNEKIFISDTTIYKELSRNLTLVPHIENAIIELKHLSFNADSTQLSKSSTEVIKHFIDDFKTSSDLYLEIACHSNNLSEAKSLKIAQLIEALFINQGYPKRKINAFGYGAKYKGKQEVLGEIIIQKISDSPDIWNYPEEGYYSQNPDK